MLNLSATAFNVGLPGPGFSLTLSAMLKSDRPSWILLFINAGIPLASLIAVVTLIVRYMALA
jgi:hypothetical protein